MERPGQFACAGPRRRCGALDRYAADARRSLDVRLRIGRTVTGIRRGCRFGEALLAARSEPLAAALDDPPAAAHEGRDLRRGIPGLVGCALTQTAGAIGELPPDVGSRARCEQQVAPMAAPQTIPVKNSDCVIECAL